MAVNPLKIFLFLLGGSAAAGATAYVSGALDPYIAPPAALVNAPAPRPSEPAAPKDERLPGAGEEAPPNTMIAAVPPPEDAATPPAAMAPEPPADAAATPPADAAKPPAGPQPPTFDIVRVEPDGSVVVAGKAMPDALVELLNGEKVLGSDKSTPEGDFAIILDERLKPGEYQLTLRATPAGGAAVASLETAVLSVPDTPGGQVLAMVEQPGQPSEIVTVPQPDAPKTEEAATPPADGENPADVASAPGETTPPASQPKTEEAVAPPAEGDKPAEVASAPADTTPPADSPKTDVAAPPPTEGQKPGEVASAPAETTPPAQSAPAPGEPKVAVEAIEIEGDKVYVAGIGEPGHFVRVYANEIVLGETRVGGGGRFLVEAKRDLPVGEYIIRADLLDADGLKVIARAAVPFGREPGEAIAAVAPDVEQPPADAGKPADAAADQTTPPAGNQAATPPAEEQKPAEVASAPDEVAPPADAARPGQPEVAVTEPPADGSAAGANPPAETPPVVAAAEPEQPPATTAPADAAQPAEAATEPPAGQDGVTQPPASDTEIAAAPPETVSPKLQNVQGAVIIRRSDTLWRISKRVYGRGIRYWTIYLANQKQISDPDRIWPGQVFMVPEKSKEGEAADMSAMRGQMTTMPTAE